MYPWISQAIKEEQMRVTEVPGLQSNERIIWYDSFTRLQATDDTVPWCSAFVCACLESTGFESTRSSQAKSYLDWGKRAAPAFIFGSIAVLERGKDQSQGHVGFVIGESDDSIILLGGNQLDSVCLMEFSKSKVIDYRLPDEPLCHAP